jgi:prevent-host-death family protein
MEITDIREAESHLPQLIERALGGEEVIIAEAGTPVVRLVPIRPDDSPRRGGQWKGRVRIADDFGIEPA